MTTKQTLSDLHSDHYPTADQYRQRAEAWKREAENLDNSQAFRDLAYALVITLESLARHTAICEQQNGGAQ